MSVMQKTRFTIALLPGDGIGPEVVAQARGVLAAAIEASGGKVSFHEGLIGGAAIDATGSALPDDTIEACQAADAVLLGAVGGPKWDNPSAKVRPEQGLLAIRRALGLYANLRPILPHPALVGASPLRPERLAGVDLMVVRELTGGIYFGDKGLAALPSGGERAHDLCSYDTNEIERIVRVGADLARQRRGRLTSVDKANVLETSRLWRRVVNEVAADYDDVEVEHMLVDNAAMQFVYAIDGFDVLVTENMFGDILSDLAASLTGGIGLAPSASLSDAGPGLFEPVHGSAPDIAGQGVANPMAMMLSTALMLEHGLGRRDEAGRLSDAVWATYAADGGRFRTSEFGDAVLRALS
jgi:3-isopropylmalate dehydrogenase